MNYKEEVGKAMELLAAHPKTFFLGQTVVYPGSVISSTLEAVPKERKLELPVAEEMQMGISIGLALRGILPISIYPRIDFLLLACNQLANHLDILAEMTHGEYEAKVIIRTIVGASNPLYPGLQHCRDHTEAFRALLKTIEVVKLRAADQIVPAYQAALEAKGSTILVEEGSCYDN